MADAELTQQKNLGIAPGVAAKVRVVCESSGRSSKCLAEGHNSAMLEQKNIAVGILDGQRLSILLRVDPLLVQLPGRFAEVCRLERQARFGAERGSRHNLNLFT